VIDSTKQRTTACRSIDDEASSQNSRVTTMWDLIPSWLADPSAYAQPENLDMTTVIVVALANLFFGLCCLAVYECVRRKTPRTYSPRINLGHATPPPLPTNYPLQWVAPLMRLDEEQILAIGGYDVLVYLRFTALSLKIFGSFAPYAVILLIVNMSASYDDGPSLPNLFTRLSLAVIPERDPRLWAHLLGIVILTSLTFHWLGRECRWYTRLRHRFLLERPDARVVFVRRLPPKLRGSRALAAYFDELYPGKVVGAVGARRTATLDSLIAARDAHRVRAARLRRRRAQHKGRGLSCVDKAHARLEDVYDPLFWTRSLDAAARLRLHDERAAERDDRLLRERQRAAAQEPLVASGQAAAPVSSEKNGEHPNVARLSSGAWEADDECAGGVIFFPSRRWRTLHAIDATQAPHAAFPSAMAYAVRLPYPARHRRDESTPTVAPIAGGRTSRRPGPRPGPRCAVDMRRRRRRACFREDGRRGKRGPPSGPASSASGR